MTNLWVIEAISVSFGTKRRYRYLQQDIRQGTWQFPCTFYNTYGKVHGNFHVPYHVFHCKVHGNFHVPCNSGLGKATLAKPTWKRDFRVPHKQADDQLLE